MVKSGRKESVDSTRIGTAFSMRAALMYSAKKKSSFVSRMASVTASAVLVTLMGTACLAADFAKEVQNAAAAQGATPKTVEDVNGKGEIVPTDPLANFGPPSGTVVSNRALELREEVLRLRASVNKDSGEFTTLRDNDTSGNTLYRSTVAAITSRLKNGTTRGNPILLRQWADADGELNKLTTSYNRLNTLQTSIDADSSVATYLMNSIQASFEISGAVDEDHDQLKLLRDDVRRQITQLDFMRTQTTADIEKQNTYLSTERSNLQNLSMAISQGKLPNAVVPVDTANAPVTKAQLATAPLPAVPPVPPVPAVPTSQTPAVIPDTTAEALAPKTASVAPPPLVPALVSPLTHRTATDSPTLGHLLLLIRYDREDIEFQSALSQAVAQVMERKPDATYEIVAVVPAEEKGAELKKAKETAEHNAEEIKNAMIQLGLKDGSIITAATRSREADTPEVHIYVR